MSLKTRIFFLVTLVVIASFLLVIGVISGKTLQLAEKDAFDLAQETAEKYKNEILAELQGARVTAETLATVFETLKNHDLTDRGVMNDILGAALAKKDYITAFCVAYDPDMLDGKDAEYAGQEPAYAASGRYAPYWNKLGGNIEVEPLQDKDIDIADWYIVPRETKNEYITNPYPYEVQGNPVMLASLVFPIVHRDRFIGIVASDIVLDKLQEMVSRVNPRGQGGFTEILSNSGAVVAHPDKRYLGKGLMEAVLFHKLETRPELVAGAVRSLERSAAGLPAEDPSGADGRREQAERLAAALKAHAANPGGVELDISLFTPELTRDLLESVAATGKYAKEAEEAVKAGNNHINRDEDFYTVYMPIRFSEATLPWSVAVSIPVRQVLENADRIRDYAIAVSVAAVCAIALILYFISKSVTWPILRLADVAKTIGEGNLQARIPEVGAGNEIGALAGALRFMVGKNGELIGELQGYAEKLEEQNEHLTRLDRLKDEFLANTSHELRTPIHGIIGIAESMIEGATGALTKEQKYNLTIVSNSGKRLSNMINDILDFTKLKNKEITLQLKAVDLNPMVDNVLALTRTLVKGKQVELKNEIGDAFPLVEADENRIQQILYNLIGNAVKFTEKGEVRVSAAIEDGMAAVAVSDSGIGIPEDKFEQIFESFEQVDGSTEREYGGTGLGLSITKRLVELHGGALSVTSKLGAGSTFTFTIPVSDAKKTRAFEPRAPKSTLGMGDYPDDGEIAEDGPALADGTVFRILAVDDEPVNIQVLKNLLGMQNYSIAAAYSGAEALNRFEAGELFDLVLLDVMMPKMSGYEVCRTLRREYSLFELPILMLTAKNQLQDIVLGFQSGANDYLPKPFDKAELLARAQTLLSLKHAVTSAIQNEKLFENEKQKRILERTLLEVTNAITSTLDLKEVLTKVMEAMSNFIHFSKSIVALKEDGRFEVAVVGGRDAEGIREGSPLDVSGDGFLREIAATRKPVIGRGAESGFQKWRGDGELLAGVPILYRGDILGVIVISCREEDVSRELLFTLAGQAGVAIQNARMFKKISVMATTDGLTGLYNRRYFFELVEKEFAKFKRHGRGFAVCMLDLDHFKNINDTHGHAIGDEVLRHLSRKLTQTLRDYDIVGRYGGEEFAVAFPDTPPKVAAAIMERFRAAIADSTVETESGAEVRYTVSVGVASFAKDGVSVQEVFDKADKRLYQAKSGGRNRVVAR
jgi:diguanylate cyclase (GGDEF)-like protein